jgi:hypothetical protein
LTTPLAYYDLIETFATPGCAVCNLVLRDVDQFLDSLLYEYVNKRDTHRTFRASRGLCNEHSWQLLRYSGSSLGIAILSRAVVDELLKTLENVPTTPASTSGLARLRGNQKATRANRATRANAASLADRLDPTEPCPACTARANAEQQFLQTLSTYIGDDKMDAAYRDSAGLCLPHFQALLRHPNASPHLEHIVSIQRSIWSRLMSDLEEFADKNRHERMHEAMGPEADSWQRAIASIAGQKGVFGLRQP